MERPIIFYFLNRNYYLITGLNIKSMSSNIVFTSVASDVNNPVEYIIFSAIPIIYFTFNKFYVFITW